MVDLELVVRRAPDGCDEDDACRLVSNLVRSMATKDAGARDYRATLNLPKTDFPMKADLPAKEPARVAWWAEHAVYERRLAANERNPQWILHDGPPYANGDLHMGHFVNRVLKDVFVKAHLLSGAWAKFVPGWDMHGLPIEFETLKHLALDFHRVDPIELRAKCRERAEYWLDKQRATILRMGVLGEYAHPYRTIDKEFEATIVATLGDLAAEKQLYKGLRATLWCMRDETALAEAEIEYKDRVSPSIYVRFAADGAQCADLRARFGAAGEGDDEVPLAIVIWTTTPWTLPANVAIAVKPEAPYALVRATHGDGRREDLVVAEALVEHVVGKLRAGGAEIAATERLALADGSGLVGAHVRHPFLDRDSAVVGAEYVELDTGTGAVHTAPGHGADDFDTGRKFGLPVLSPVDAAGRFTRDGGGAYAAEFVFDANPKIVADLRASGALVALDEYAHSYPHCWRCKQPVIFRATSQWFISMDRNDLRTRIEKKIPEVAWFPAWGENRMLQMIENHPEWCVSRQRTWGTPIPAVQCADCGESFLDPAVARTAAQVFRERGEPGRNASDLWWTEPVATFVPAGTTCPRCTGTSFVKEFNIVDIWFESGVTHRAVLEPRGMHWPADLYLEGGDQYRGWFRSNIVTAVATKGTPPYKAVVSTGWVVDAEGHAMHKSAGNYIAATDGMQKYGADVLRLWVASVEFTADMRLGEVLLGAVSQVYRNLRNRFRMMLGLVADLRPEDLVPRAELAPLDALALAKLDDLAYRVREAYDAYRLHDAYLALVEFDASDLSSFYLDGLKDPLYSGNAGGARRRSAQTAVFGILESLCALLAPILSFTTEEVWQSLSPELRAGRESVFDLELPRGSARGAAELTELRTWDLVRGLRAKVAASEGPRDFATQATIGASLTDGLALGALGDTLREALVVSQLDLAVDGDAVDGAPKLVIAPADGAKCARCWKYRELGALPAHPTICGPCAETVDVFEAAR